jgi:hypothetical protein
MTRASSIRACISLFFLALAVSAAAAPPDQTALRIGFKIADDYLVVVPVTINGAGPFNFLLDTGGTQSIIDPKLAQQLALPRAGQNPRDSLLGPLGSTPVTVVHSQSLALAGGEVRGLDLLVRTQGDALPGKARGLLCEDFLSHFDLLIDYRHREVELDTGAHGLAEQLDGQHLSISLNGRLPQGYTEHRLVITGRAIEFGDKPVTLLLDSGTNLLYLFGGGSVLGALATQDDCTYAAATGNSDQAVYKRKIQLLHFGDASVPDIVATAPRSPAPMDTDGLMPTSVFHSIFISHSSHFVILNPTRKPAPILESAM